jgi:hypothetical protein
MAKRTSSSEASKVKSVNNAYYKALSARDMSAMERVWTCASHNILIAPPGAIIILDADEWSEFALGQLVSLGIGTFIVALVTLVVLILGSIW